MGEGVEVAAVQEQHPVRDPVLGGQFLDHPLVVDQARIERMQLEHQPGGRRRMPREAGDGLRNEGLVGVAGMLPQLAVARPLQQRDEIGFGGSDQLGGPRRHALAGELVLGVARDRADDLVEHRQGEGVAALGEGRGEQDLVQIVPHGPQNQPLGRGPHLGVADGDLVGRQAMVAVEAGVPGTGRVGVDAVRLQCDPPRTEIAFLEHMHPQAAPLGGGDGGHVHFQAVVEHHQVGDAVLAKVAVDPARPGFLPVAIGHVGARIAPVRQVAAVEHHLADSIAGLAQPFGDVGEEGAERPPQEQEVPLPGVVHQGSRAPVGARPAAERVAVEAAIARDAVQRRCHTLPPRNHSTPMQERGSRWRPAQAPCSPDAPSARVQPYAPPAPPRRLANQWLSSTRVRRLCNRPSVSAARSEKDN